MDHCERDGPRFTTSISRAPTVPAALQLSVVSVAIAWSLFHGHSSDAPPRGRTALTEPTVRTVEIGHGGGIDVAVGAGGVWVTTRDATLQVDPNTNEVVKEIPVDGAFRLDVADNAVWVTSSSTGNLSRIDPVTGAVIATLEVVSTAAYDVAVTD